VEVREHRKHSRGQNSHTWTDPRSRLELIDSEQGTKTTAAAVPEVAIVEQSIHDGGRIAAFLLCSDFLEGIERIAGVRWRCKKARSVGPVSSHTGTVSAWVMSDSTTTASNTAPTPTKSRP
jgi:hypothetical protein